MPAEPGSSTPHRLPVTRRELIAVLVVTLVAATLRGWHLERAAVEHFDEGVYASNLFCPPDHAYPSRHLYAPPLWPAVLEWAMILTGTTSAVMAVNVLGGALTVASVWWVTRAWLTPPAALAAMTLAATSQLHIAYSRTALTDVLLCLWMLWGVFFAWRALRGCSSGWPGLTGGKARNVVRRAIGSAPEPAAPAAPPASRVEGSALQDARLSTRNTQLSIVVVAGLLAALAWWTKYNGWLTLAISGAGLAAWLIVDGVPQGRARRLVCWASIACVAALAWAPVLWDLQEVGGYTAVAENHARYFVGLQGWRDGLVRQGANIDMFERAAAIGVGLALVAAVVPLLPGGGCRESSEAAEAPFHVKPNPPGERPPAPVADRGAAADFAALLLAAAVSGWGWAAVLAVLSSYGIGRSLIDFRGATFAPERSLGVWMLAAWWAGLLVAVPLYHPYSRLVLPWMVAAWIGAGAGLSFPLRSLIGVITQRSGQEEQPAGSAGRAGSSTDQQREGRRSLFRELSIRDVRGGWLPGLGLCALIGALVISERGEGPGAAPAWEDRRSLAEAADRALRRIGGETGEGGAEVAGVRGVAYVVGEPGLFFQLAAAAAEGLPSLVVLPARDFSPAAPGATDERVPTFVLSVDRAAAPAAARAYADRLRRIDAWPYHPSTLVQLDEFPPAALSDPSALPAEEVRLFRLVHQR